MYGCTSKPSSYSIYCTEPRERQPRQVWSWQFNFSINLGIRLLTEYWEYKLPKSCCESFNLWFAVALDHTFQQKVLEQEGSVGWLNHELVMTLFIMSIFVVVFFLNCLFPVLFYLVILIFCVFPSYSMSKLQKEIIIDFVDNAVSNLIVETRSLFEFVWVIREVDNQGSEINDPGSLLFGVLQRNVKS